MPTCGVANLVLSFTLLLPSRFLPFVYTGGPFLILYLAINFFASTSSEPTRVQPTSVLIYCTTFAKQRMHWHDSSNNPKNDMNRLHLSGFS
ncbi:hypothetical protein LZ32DRAFT_610081 [Colletotrichum eremochloae]|nr:hypothetical protein LZ32DRAFT_610081 [Colletotrichum eremochloae]